MTTSDRLLSVLGLFTAERPEWTVEEAASELSLAVSTAYRYFRSLAHAGLIAAFSAGRYVLGPAIIQYDRQMRLHDPLITTAQPVMRRLSQRAPPHSVVLLCRVYRDQVMCVHQESAERPDFSVSYQRGRPMPLYRGASSKIILAHLPPRTIKSFYERHATEMAQAGLGKNWEEVKVRLRTLRNAGVCVTQAELDIGMSGIAVPVFEPESGVVGSLSIVLPVTDRTQRVIAKATEILTEAHDEIHWAFSLLSSGHDGGTRPSAAHATSQDAVRGSAKRTVKSKRSVRAKRGRSKA